MSTYVVLLNLKNAAEPYFTKAKSETFPAVLAARMIIWHLSKTGAILESS